MENPLSPCPNTPNCFRATFGLSANENTVLDLAVETLQTQKGLLIGKSVSLNRTTHRLNAIYKIGPYRDDVVVVTEALSATETAFYIRSASRTGYTDYGVNKRRVNRIVDAIKAALAE